MSYRTRGPAQAGIGSKATSTKGAGRREATVPSIARDGPKDRNGAGRRHDERNTSPRARKEAV
jgi:hypothetical protein